MVLVLWHPIVENNASNLKNISKTIAYQTTFLEADDFFLKKRITQKEV
jgi:hypothetical protein